MPRAHMIDFMEQLIYLSVISYLTAKLLIVYVSKTILSPFEDHTISILSPISIENNLPVVRITATEGNGRHFKCLPFKCRIWNIYCPIQECQRRSLQYFDDCPDHFSFFEKPCKLFFFKGCNPNFNHFQLLVPHWKTRNLHRLFAIRQTYTAKMASVKWIFIFF